MRGHKLKCWPEPFAAIRNGEKICELRRADRIEGLTKRCGCQKFRQSRKRGTSKGTGT